MSGDGGEVGRGAGGESKVREGGGRGGREECKCSGKVKGRIGIREGGSKHDAAFRRYSQPGKYSRDLFSSTRAVIAPWRKYPGKNPHVQITRAKNGASVRPPCHAGLQTGM